MEVRKSFPEEGAPVQRPERGMRIGQAKWRGRQGGWGCWWRKEQHVQRLGPKRQCMLQGLGVQERRTNERFILNVILMKDTYFWSHEAPKHKPATLSGAQLKI